MQPYPLPLGTLRLQVFKDTVPVDGTYEADAEPGLAGFTTHLNDVLGEVTTDFYGNRLCTNYVHTKTTWPPPTRTTRRRRHARAPATRGRTTTSPRRCVFDARLPRSSTRPTRAARAYSDVDGLRRDPEPRPRPLHRHGHPPSGQNWYQTTTLEGNHDWDMWIPRVTPATTTS